MKKLLFLLFMCLGIFLQAKAYPVILDINNTQYAKEYGKTTNACSMGLNGCYQLLKTCSGYGTGCMFDCLAYCTANGIYESVVFDGPYKPGIQNEGKQECSGYVKDDGRHWCDIKYRIIDGTEIFTSYPIETTCTSTKIKGQSIIAKGIEFIHLAEYSPFIYTQNSPSQNLQITINSPFNNYHNQLPAFNLKNGWEIIAEQNHFIVNKAPKDHLFYELAMNKITLNRNGQNFASQADLTNYLQNSDFFIKLGLNETQKANSLNYILPQLPVANNYYLTILSDKSIQEISELNINPAPKQVNRIYYAIYPTTSPVKTNGDLVFPVNQQTKEFTILESGEILVKPEMFVFWE